MSRLLLPGYPWRVRAMPVAPQQGLQPALSVTILAGHTAGHFSLVGPGLAISLRNRLKKSSSIWQPAIWAPNSDSASSVLQISTVLILYDGYIHYVQTLSTRLKLWFWVWILGIEIQFSGHLIHFVKKGRDCPWQSFPVFHITDKNFSKNLWKSTQSMVLNVLVS